MHASPSATTDQTLERLWHQAQAGDERAFEQFYRSAVGQIYGLCLRMCADVTRAEDATQAAFVQAWRNLGKFRGEAKLMTWLHRIAVNEVLGSRRRERRHDHEPEELASSAATRPTHDIDLERAIGLLPEQARRVFVLHGVYGYGHRETADLLGIAEGTSKAHYHAARRMLRTALTEAEGGDV